MRCWRNEKCVPTWDAFRKGGRSCPIFEKNQPQSEKNLSNRKGVQAVKRFMQPVGRSLRNTQGLARHDQKNSDNSTETEAAVDCTTQAVGKAVSQSVRALRGTAVKTAAQIKTWQRAAGQQSDISANILRSVARQTATAAAGENAAVCRSKIPKEIPDGPAGATK